MMLVWPEIHQGAVSLCGKMVTGGSSETSRSSGALEEGRWVSVSVPSMGRVNCGAGAVGNAAGNWARLCDRHSIRQRIVSSLRNRGSARVRYENGARPIIKGYCVKDVTAGNKLYLTI